MGKLTNLLKIFGLDFGQMSKAASGLPKFFQDYRQFRVAYKASARTDFPITKFYPMLSDYRASSGVATGHYFHQDILMARRVYEARPRRHVDIGSRVDGFVGHVAVFREIEVADIRPLTTSSRNIKFVQCDVTDAGSVNKLGKADLVSCLHSIEHFGLGRYGDPLCVDGHEVGLKNLGSMVEPGGILLVSVPIGPQRIEFNGHRVFAAATLPQLVSEAFKLERFSYIDDNGDLHEDAGFDPDDVARHFGCWFGCGLYEFRRSQV